MPTETEVNIRGRSLIGYSEGPDRDHNTHATDPSTQEALDPLFASATEEDVENAARLASEAALKYRELGGHNRAKFLRECAAQIEALGDTLTQRAMQETGLPEGRIKGETARTAGQLRLFADLVEEGSWSQARIDRAQPDREPLPKPDVRSMLRPLGPVVVFAASNFPLAFSAAGGDTASALAAGCPVIVKAHSSHPGTAELVGQAVVAAARACNLPEGVFSLLFGSGRDVGAALVAHPAVKAVGFTGSTAGGTTLMKIAAEREEPIPVYAEMGSVNPVVLLPDALEQRGEAIAAGLHGSATLGAGQFCTNPGVVLTPRTEAADAFIEAFKAKMEASDAQVMLNESIQNAYLAGVEAWSKDDRIRTLVAKKSTGCRGSASVFEVDGSVFLADKTLSHEIFGPGTMTVRYDDEEELKKLLESLSGQLTGTLQASDADLRKYASIVPILERKVGRIVFNGFPTGVEVCHAMVHGGPYPATSDGKSTSVGTHAIERFARLVAYQDCPDALLPAELKEANPLGIARLEDGKHAVG